MLHKRRVSGSTSFMSSVGEAGLQYGGGIFVCVYVHIYNPMYIYIYIYIYIGFRAWGVCIYTHIYIYTYAGLRNLKQATTIWICNIM